MYVSNRKNCINVSFLFDKKKVAKKALLDSGATNNFVNQRTVNCLHISTRRLEKPRILYNVDKTENKSGQITHYVNLEITRGTQVQVQRFYVANLGTDHFILGFPWLYEFNPEIDWRQHTANRLPLHLGPTMKTTRDTLVANLIQMAKDMHSRLTWTHEWEEGDEIIVNKTNFAQEWAIEANQGKHLEAIPEEYQRHKKVFSEIEAQQFPCYAQALSVVGTRPR